VVHPQHFFPLQSLISTLFHHLLGVPSCVKVCQQVSLDEGLCVVDHERHDDFGDEIATCLGDNLHVGVHQVPDRLHLPLKLWVYGTSTATSRLLIIGSPLSAGLFGVNTSS